jgi:hypothetical protein
MNAAQYLLTISMIVAAQTPMRQLHAEATAPDVQLPQRQHLQKPDPDNCAFAALATFERSNSTPVRGVT